MVSSAVNFLAGKELKLKLSFTGAFLIDLGEKWKGINYNYYQSVLF